MSTTERMTTKRLTTGEFAAEVERLLWTLQSPTPDLTENLGLIETLLEDYDASTRAHLALAKTVLKSAVWADHDELSQNLLWALYTLHDQGNMRLGMSFPSAPRSRASVKRTRPARGKVGRVGVEQDGVEQIGTEQNGAVQDGVEQDGAVTGLQEVESKTQGAAVAQSHRATPARAASAGDGDAPD